ncbi:diacylglycerol O-acyltransferase 1-like isoform X1 [Haliotis rufescens]|uniref:diacylglycerol O-acyltransferase 1-like isoform X1 n=1 Tax=Haliotis rufescens TaxID=6454 RepID=UPI001EAFE08A|nr:diacylglycerol O-acyltransferase 1-like isoform X1 [Haliotis rufescens]
MAAANGYCANSNTISNGRNLNCQVSKDYLQNESTDEISECLCNTSGNDDEVKSKTVTSNNRTRKRKSKQAKTKQDSDNLDGHVSDKLTTPTNNCPKHGPHMPQGFWGRNLPGWCFEPEYFVTEKGEKRPHEIHQNADSLFSTSSGFTNYRGLLNLCLILLVLSNARLFLENIMKYGILIDPISWLHLFVKDPYNWPNIIVLLSTNVFILFAFAIEKLHAKDFLSERVGTVFKGLNTILLLVYPATVVYILHTSPVFSVNTLGCVTIVFLKLISYHCVNRWCRESLKTQPRKMGRSKTLTTEDEAAKQVKMAAANEKIIGKQVYYPDNLNLKDMYYFMCAPTLCYELNFPRSARIRKRFLMKRIIEILFLWQLMLGLVQQWVIPTLNNAMQPLDQMNLFKVLERLLKLAVPNHFIWLIFFYWFFHSFLNALAEVLRFGDRVFYHDWWNAETVSDFWKNWNIPVHRWASRHLYKPMLRQGFNKLTGSVAVFFVSAFFHEYLLSIPLRMFKVWAFTAMLGQVPLALMTGKYLDSKTGNIVVWLSLILGQPVAILAYVHDYYIINVGTLTNQTITIG